MKLRAFAVGTPPPVELLLAGGLQWKRITKALSHEVDYLHLPSGLKIVAYSATEWIVLDELGDAYLAISGGPLVFVTLAAAKTWVVEVTTVWRS